MPSPTFIGSTVLVCRLTYPDKTHMLPIVLTSISKNFEFKNIVGIYATKSTETSIVKLLMIT